MRMGQANANGWQRQTLSSLTLILALEDWGNNINIHQDCQTIILYHYHYHYHHEFGFGFGQEQETKTKNKNKKNKHRRRRDDWALCWLCVCLYLYLHSIWTATRLLKSKSSSCSCSSFADADSSSVVSRLILIKQALLVVVLLGSNPGTVAGRQKEVPLYHGSVFMSFN